MPRSLRDAARGKPCQVRSPVCIDGDHTTTILAHLRMAGISGIALKAHDLLGSWCCAACHDLIDSRIPRGELSRLEVRVMHLEGCMRTIDKLIREGAIKC